jgi:Trehalose utilisation
MTNGQPASGGPSLSTVDAIFFLGHREIDLDAKQKADLLSFVKEDGKGFLGAHTATTAFLSWPEFGDMFGGRYDNHPWNTVEAPVINEDPSFPAAKPTAGFPISPTSSIKRRTFRVRMRGCCCGWTHPNCRQTRSSAAPTASFHSRGPGCTGKGESSTPHGDMTRRRGTIPTFITCISKP